MVEVFEHLATHLLIDQTSHASEASREHLLIGLDSSEPIRNNINILLKFRESENIVSHP
jgi:hypothetical protein